MCQRMSFWCVLFNHQLLNTHGIFQNSAKRVIFDWYGGMRRQGTPKKLSNPYFESPIGGKGGETPLSPEYKGKVPSEVGRRKSLRKTKDHTNVARVLWADPGGAEEGALDTAQDVGSSDRESSVSSDGENEDEDL